MLRSLTSRVLTGLVLGLAGGIWLGSVEASWAGTVVAWIEPVGALWVNAIRMTVIPLIVSLLLGGIASSGAGTLASVGGRAVAWFLGLVACTTTLAAATVPALYTMLGAERWQIPDVGGAGAAADVTLPPFRDWFVGLLPANPVQAAAQGDILPLVLFTVVFGLAATRIAPELKATLIRGAQAVSEAILVVVGWILATAPVGVFALTLALAAQTGFAVIRAVGGFFLVVAILLTVAIVVLYPLVRVVGGIPVRLFARACAPAQAVGFSTRSSMATLPVLLEEAERTLELPERVSGLVLPAAVSVFKYGSPMTRIAGTYLIATLFGIELGLFEWVTLSAFLGVLSFYSPGIPSGGLFVMAPIYQAFGLPLEGIGILIALDMVPDMLLTTANVTANMAVAGLVAKGAAPVRNVATAGLLLAAFAAASPLSAQQPTLALVGGRVLDGFGGPVVENGVVLVAGERIVAVGPRSEVDVPAGVRVVDTEGMTVMPGLCDMHVHLQLLGHGDYARWDELYRDRNEEVMAIGARQLLEAGVTCARDLGGPLDELVATKRRIADGEIPGPRLFISGPFLQRAPYEAYEADYRWGVDGAADARAKARRLIDAGVDVIKLIDQDHLTSEEVSAIVETAHAAGKPVVAHAHRMDEIRVGLEHGVDNFEHTGLGTAPGYAEDVLQALSERNTAVYWTPTISPLYVMQYTGEVFPERLDDPSWRAHMPRDMADEIRASLEHIPHLPYYALFPSRIPILPHKFEQIRRTGVRLLIGTDSGIPSMFHTDSTWREMLKWVELGVPPMQVLQAATLWPGRFFGRDDLGNLAPGSLADIIAVRGDPLTDMGVLRRVDVIVKGGEVVR